jgi:hypothetical protein
MSYAGGRYVVTAVEGNVATLENWEDPKDVVQVTFPSGKVQIGNQYLRKVTRLKPGNRMGYPAGEYSTFEFAKLQKKRRGRIIAASSGITTTMTNKPDSI